VRQLVTQSNWKVRTQGGKPNDEHDNLFAEVWNHHHVIPMSLLRKLELPTKSQLQAGSLSTAFLTPLSSCFFPCGGEADIHKLFHGSPQSWEL
jgi:hypothetical protein